MIKKNFVLAISVFALFATGAVHADIASTEYVIDNALDSVEVFNITEELGFSVPYITGGTLYLPTAWGNSDEIRPGLAVLASSDEGYQFAIDDYEYNKFSIAPTVNYMKDSIRNTFAQKAIWVSPCYDPESEDCVTSAAGVIKGVHIGRGYNNYDSVPAQILDGVIEIPLANDYESSYAPGVVRVANDSDEYDEILETFDPDREVGVVGSTVPTVEYMKNAIAANKPNAAGSISTPVYVDSSGKAAAVSSIATSLLPMAVSEADAAGDSVEPGIVWVAAGPGDAAISEAQGEPVVPSLDYFKKSVIDSRVMSGEANYTLSCVTNISIAQGSIEDAEDGEEEGGVVGSRYLDIETGPIQEATHEQLGVAKLGVIPAGADKASTATIWIE